MGSRVLNDNEVDAVNGGASDDRTFELLQACDDLLMAISCSDIDDERVENKALALASMVATVRNG